jgi:hypothetical protein
MESQEDVLRAGAPTLEDDVEELQVWGVKNNDDVAGDL